MKSNKKGRKITIIRHSEIALDYKKLLQSNLEKYVLHDFNVK